MPTTPSLETLNGIPPVDVFANVQAALAKGRGATEIAAETVALRLAPGKLSPQEYFYYRLWDERLTLAAKKAFVGKMAQHPMHVAAGHREWFAASADKILFHSIMTASRYRLPETLAITQANRHFPDIPTIADADGFGAVPPHPIALSTVRQAGRWEIQPLCCQRRQLRRQHRRGDPARRRAASNRHFGRVSCRRRRIPASAPSETLLRTSRNALAQGFGPCACWSL